MVCLWLDRAEPGGLRDVYLARAVRQRVLLAVRGGAELFTLEVKMTPYYKDTKALLTPIHTGCKFTA